MEYDIILSHFSDSIRSFWDFNGMSKNKTKQQNKTNKQTKKQSIETFILIILKNNYTGGFMTNDGFSDRKELQYYERW